MKPKIDQTQFGSITVAGKRYEHDIVITLSGEVLKRKKKLSKSVYGTSHKISKEETKFVYEKGAEQLIIGTGQYGVAELSDPAEEFLRKKSCCVHTLPTPEAINEWNKAVGNVIGLFHITC
jgi:hypothetical protein